MKKSLLAIAALALLAACAGSGTGNTQMYGEIKGGVEIPILKNNIQTGSP
jgi:uncharacterized lipoprotein YmbA